MPFPNPFKRSTPASTPSQQHYPVISNPVQVFHSSYNGPTRSITPGTASDPISPQSTDSRLGDLSSSSSSTGSSPGYTTAYSAATSSTSPTMLRKHRAKQSIMESSKISFDTVLPSPDRSPVTKRYSKPSRRMTRSRQATDDTVRGTATPRTRHRAQSTLPPSSATTDGTQAHSAPRPTRPRETTLQQRPTLHRRASSMDDVRMRLASAKAPVLRPALDQSGQSGPNRSESGTHERARTVTARSKQSSPFALEQQATPEIHQTGSTSESGTVDAADHASLAPRQTISPAEGRDTSNCLSPVQKGILSPRTSPCKLPRPRYHPSPTPSLPPRSGSESGVSSSSGYKFSSSSSTPPSVASAAPSPFSPDLFSPALEADPLPAARIPLKLYVANDGESQTLGTIDASEEVCVFIRGDRSQMAELEVALVCLAEADETVYKLRISRRSLSASSLSAATPSLRHKNSNLAPKLLCTPPVSSEILERTSYFSPMKSTARASPRTIRKATSGPLPPQHRRLSTSSPTLTKSIWNAPLTSNELSMLGTPKRAPSPRAPSRSVARTGKFATEVRSQETAIADTQVLSTGFSSEYSTVAQAYRAAHTAADGGAPDSTTPLSATSFDSNLLHSPERSLRTQRSDMSLSPRRSPQHRFALYVPPGGAADSEDESQIATTGATTADAAEGAERTPATSTSGGSQAAGQITPEWHDYTSTYEGYTSAARRESTDKQPATKTSPSLSIRSLSPPSSPSALLQRRLANKPQTQMQESSFNLGLGVHGLGSGAILGGLSSHSESTVAPPSTCSISKDDDVKSLSSLRYEGQQGWSTTEDEHSSSDADSGTDNDEDGFGNRLGDIGIPSDTESTATFGLAEYDMKIKILSGSGGNTRGSGSGDGSGEIDAVSISMSNSP